MVTLLVDAEASLSFSFYFYACAQQQMQFVALHAMLRSCVAVVVYVCGHGGFGAVRFEVAGGVSFDCWLQVSIFWCLLVVAAVASFSGGEQKNVDAVIALRLLLQQVRGHNVLLCVGVL